MYSKHFVAVFNWERT